MPFQPDRHLHLAALIGDDRVDLRLVGSKPPDAPMLPAQRAGMDPRALLGSKGLASDLFAAEDPVLPVEAVEREARPRRAIGASVDRTGAKVAHIAAGACRAFRFERFYLILHRGRKIRMETFINHLLPRRGGKIEVRRGHKNKTTTGCNAPASRRDAMPLATG